jgi:hypothetical protein
MKRLGVVLCLVLAIVAPDRARAQQGVDPFLQPAPAGPPESGISIGLSVGYGLPMGNVSATQAMTDVFSGALPIQLDLGYRFTPNLYLGGFFQYSIGFTSSTLNERCVANLWTGCSASDMQFGATFVYTFLPYSTFAPYAGLGVGWEILSVNYSGTAQSVSESVSGFQFARFTLGGDFRVGSTFRVGPFASFSLGQFSGGTITEQALHEWLQFGLKGTVDL